MLIRTVALLVLFTGLNTAFAEELTPTEMCELSSMTLEKDTQIECHGNITVAPGTVIDTNGHFLQIVSHGGADFGSGAGLTIDSKGQPGIISIFAINTISGQLNIRNVNAENGLGGEIDITAGSLYDYQQSVDNGLNQPPTVIAGGEELILEGDRNSIASN